MSVEYPNIAVLGKAGAGKDKVAELLQERFALSYRRFALADPLKEVAERIWGPTARTDRAKLQGLGVAVRGIDEYAWVDLLQRRIAEVKAVVPGIRVVVTDCRFFNEYLTLRGDGFLTVRVEADKDLRIQRLRAIGKLQDEADLDHVSETELDGASVEYTLTNNGTEDELAEQLAAMLDRVAR